MVDAAPRISPRLADAIERFDDGKVPIAEVCRRVGEHAERIGVPRPSYEQVRTLVHAARRWRRFNPSTVDVALDVAMRAKPPTAILDHLAGTG